MIASCHVFLASNESYVSGVAIASSFAIMTRMYDEGRVSFVKSKRSAGFSTIMKD